MHEASRGARRGALLALDVGICAVLLVFAVSFVAIRSNLHQYNSDAEAIAQWATSLGKTRIAWPADKREAVPKLLASDVTPVLVASPHPPAQQLFVNNTPILVTTDPDYLSSLSTDQFQSGPFTARVIDLIKAHSVPIANGEAIGEQVSRPYLYAPLRNSRPIAAGKPWATKVILEAGHYSFTVAIFDPRARGIGTLTVGIGDKQLATKASRLQSAMFTPMSVEFDVPDKKPVAVDIKIAVTGPATGGAVNGFVHEWEVRRQDRAP